MYTLVAKDNVSMAIPFVDKLIETLMQIRKFY